MSEHLGKTYVMASRELRMCGESVAVCWNLAKDQSTHCCTLDDGRQAQVTTSTTRRVGPPYIDFVWLRQDSKSGEWYEDEGSPVSGGLAVSYAETIVEELREALRFLQGTSHA